MSKLSSVFGIRSKSFGREFGKFYAKQTGDNFTVYNGLGDVKGRYNSLEVAEKMAENLAHRQLSALKFNLGISGSTDIAKSVDDLIADEEFLNRNLDCMVGGFYIVNGHPKSKCYYLIYQKNSEIKFIYDSYAAAFADLRTLFTVKDLEVYKY